MESEEARFLSYPKHLIECPVCLGTFDQPKVLPCQHTFCLACLDRLRSPDNRVTCPICQRTSALPVDGGAARLPTNFFLVQLLDVSRPRSVEDREEKEEEEETVYCDACVYSSSLSSSAVAESFCVDCAQSLCRECVNAHSGIRALRHHRLSAIDTAAAKDPGDRRRQQLLAAARPVFCVDHPTNEIAFYCRDCSASICVKCGFLRHRNHDCADVEEKADESRRDVDRMAGEIARKISDCRSVRQDLNRELSSFDETAEKIRKQIAERTEEVISCVRRQEQDLLKAVNSIEKRFRLPIEVLCEEVESKIGNMESFVQFCRQLIEFGAHNDVISLWPQMMASGEQYRAVHFARTSVPKLVFSPSTVKLDDFKVVGDIACESSNDDDTSEILKDCLSTISNCDVEGMSPSSSCVQSAEAFDTTALEEVREGNGGDSVRASDQRCLKLQNSLTSNEDDDESGDSTEYNSSDQSLDDATNENKDFWDEDDVAYGQKPRKERSQEEDVVVSDLMSLQLNSPVDVVETIPGKDPIAGIAVLLDHLYVLRLRSNLLERYDLRTHRPVALEYPAVRNPTDLAACSANDTLYIGQTNKSVFRLRVTRPEATPQRLAVALTYKHLSVTADASVLMGCPKADTILEYAATPVWTELRRISIPGSHPTSMVQISPKLFVVSSKMNVLYLVGVDGSEVDYRCLSVPHNISHIAADVSGPRLIVANCYGHSILRLDPRSAGLAGGARSWPIVEPKTVSRPSRLWTDKVGRRLYVGTTHGDVKILNLL